MPSKNAKPAAVPANVVSITKLEQLMERCQKPLLCRFKIDGAEVEIPCKRLSPAFEEIIQNIRRELQPPLIKGRTPEEDRYNLHDKTYLEKKAHAELLCRALVIYEGCPIVQQGKPNLADRQAILDYVQSLFTSQLLDLLYVTIVGGGVDLAERVNFTLPLDSVES